MKKIATLVDIEKYPELNLVEGKEFEIPDTEPLNESDEEDDEDSGGNHPTKPPGKP